MRRFTLLRIQLRFERFLNSPLYVALVLGAIFVVLHVFFKTINF